jgi:hypothetical protein
VRPAAPLNSVAHWPGAVQSVLQESIPDLPAAKVWASVRSVRLERPFRWGLLSRVLQRASAALEMAAAVEFPVMAGQPDALENRGLSLGGCAR